jgi:hypothetical protein
VEAKDVVFLGGKDYQPQFASSRGSFRGAAFSYSQFRLSKSSNPAKTGLNEPYRSRKITKKAENPMFGSTQ